MSQRNTSPLKRSTVRRTLQRFWDVTRTQPLIVFLSVFSSAGYIFLLTFANTYVMALIVDRVQAGPVAGDRVFEVFGPYILALVLVNLVGQILSKLQDYTVYKLEIAGNYHLARLCFDTLSNQSMTFHTSRFGGSLVSQTSRFMSGYTGLVDVTVYSLIPTITSVICTVAALAPVVPTFTVILVCIMAVYIAFVWLMYKRIMPLSAATSAAQNKLSGVLSDAVTNILAVKTCALEDLREVKAACRGRISILGNLNGIEMTHWTPAEAENAVKKAIAQAAPGGGFILSDGHGEIPWQVSDEVLHAIVAATRRWGTYPLQAGLADGS